MKPGRLLLALFLTGCSSVGAATPSGSRLAAAVVTPSPTPHSYWSAEKLGEGGHDGPPLITVPAAIAVDYTVRGNCLFELNVQTAQQKPAGPHLGFSVTGPEISGSWRVRLIPGDYYIYPGEAIGCIYRFNVRDDT